ncbi:hypothetical protein PCE1_004001 [Barthelona sp. PCE]
MRVKRKKEFRKVMQFYHQLFKFSQPYRVLVDGTFIQGCLDSQIMVEDQLKKMLGDFKAKIMITECCLSELSRLGGSLRGAFNIATSLEVCDCHHLDKDGEKSASECFLDLLDYSNPKKYIICSQDRRLQRMCRKKVGVPIVYLVNNAPVMEQPSENTKRSAKNRAIRAANDGKLPRRDRATGPKRKEKNPNPLSCKKKKDKTPQHQPKKKRVRSRNKKKEFTEGECTATTVVKEKESTD